LLATLSAENVEITVFKGVTDLNYEIAYYSLSGNTEKLAYGIAKRLPENQAFLTNLQEEEVTLAADVYLVAV
jgi:menaquinone-dependent protoporphyrinogen IX oxidase